MKFKRMARSASLVFTANQWKWGIPGKVPNQEEIEKGLRHLYDDHPDSVRIESGRLLVIRECDETKVCLVLGSEGPCY